MHTCNHECAIVHVLLQIGHNRLTTCTVNLKRSQANHKENTNRTTDNKQDNSPTSTYHITRVVCGSRTAGLFWHFTYLPSWKPKPFFRFLASKHRRRPQTDTDGPTSGDTRNATDGRHKTRGIGGTRLKRAARGITALTTPDRCAYGNLAVPSGTRPGSAEWWP